MSWLQGLHALMDKEVEIKAGLGRIRLKGSQSGSFYPSPAAESELLLLLQTPVRLLVGGFIEKKKNTKKKRKKNKRKKK